MKGAYSWEELKKVTLINGEALARFQPFLKKAGFPLIYAMNTMEWPYSGDIQLFIDYEVLPIENKVKIIDIATGAISSLMDKSLNQELADKANPYNLWQLVRETSQKRDVAPFVHTTVSNVKIDKGANGHVWESVKIVFETIGGALTQGQQLPSFSSDKNVAQNFVSVRGKIGRSFWSATKSRSGISAIST